MRWTDIATDPNGPEALAYRQGQLDAAVRTITDSRDDFIIQLVRGRTVLDIGCVDHDIDLAHQGWWLQGVIAGAAKHVVGVDHEPVGIARMRELGYDAICADITGDLSDVAARGPFDVIVAGEVIEHLSCPQVLLEIAPALLARGGQLLLTTPNPYAPWRVRNGQHGRVWENVDHVVYCFPGGIAEMADRAGLCLVGYGTIDTTHRQPTFKGSAREWLGSKRHRRPLSALWISPLDVVMMRVRRGPMMRERTVYLLEVAT